MNFLLCCVVVVAYGTTFVMEVKVILDRGVLGRFMHYCLAECDLWSLGSLLVKCYYCVAQNGVSIKQINTSVTAT